MDSPELASVWNVCPDDADVDVLPDDPVDVEVEPVEPVEVEPVEPVEVEPVEVEPVEVEPVEVVDEGDEEHADKSTMEIKPSISNTETSPDFNGNLFISVFSFTYLFSMLQTLVTFPVGMY